MLVQFTCKNVLSFKEENTLDMTAISSYKEHESNLISNEAKERFIKVAAIYGANASGKSNFNIAMDYFQRIIRGSLNNEDSSGKTVLEKFYEPFSFQDTSDENSEFQIIEILDGFEYQYGFEYNAETIEKEWLYRKDMKTNRVTTILERTTEVVKFGASIRRECDVYKRQIPNETLVLSFFNKLKLKTDVFENVYSGIMETLVVQSDFCENISLLEEFLPEVIDEDKERLVEFLMAIDTGIKDIAYDDSEKDVKFITFHEGRDGKKYPLSLFFESEGTIKSIMLFIYAQIAIANNCSMFIDELNTKLHPLLLKFIVDLFYDKNSMAQLIYTTHDTTLLDKRFFRRDQIWFVQKDEFGRSELLALSDFKIRSDASFEKDYLAGVYGGIPLLKGFTMKEVK